ncbi:MAG: FAD-dependent oxidoreductase, partial [Sedimentisphaerales bacterium]|nr:FAD-dependent oxidoreductase [Sedimentisphaerales bacterium]
MERRMQALLSLLLLGVLSPCSGCWQTGQKNHPAIPQDGVMQSAREIPVLYDVDVVVVGGTSGAVTAAVAAAQEGASVFLAAPRTYLGEDICGTYRLWLDPEEEPTSALAKIVFAEPDVSALLPQNTIPFTYEADVASWSPHQDTSPPSMLTDGKWHSAPSQSVQYNGDVNIVTDFGSEQFIGRVHVTVYQRAADFEVASVLVQTSNDGQNWERIARVENDRLGGSFEAEAIPLSVTVGRNARYVKLSVEKTPEAGRVLLGEILFEKETQDSPAAPYRVPPTPMRVKQALDDALLNAGVGFLYGCYATDLLYDSTGHPAGIVMANRSGRQAVRAKVIIDATQRAAVARMAGGEFDPYPAGMRTFKRIVVGGQPRRDPLIESRVLPAPVYAGNGRAYEATEYTLELPMSDGSFAAFAAAEQLARDRTWHRGQVDASEMLFQVPPDRMRARKPQCCVWPGAEKVALEAFRPAGIERMFVLGGCADVSRGAVEKMLRPLEMMRLGSRIGTAAAAEAQRTAMPLNVRVAAQAVDPVAVGDIGEDPAWMRASPDIPHIEAEPQAVPVLAEYDVVIVGGGTGGAPAGIAAARQGARTLVVEYLHGLGGIGTMGLIGKYYYGYREGFTKELDQGLAELGGEAEGRSGQGQAWDSQLKIEWYRQELRKAGADIWYGALGCGAFVDGNQVKGVVVATPHGRGVVLARAVIDCTGSAVIAAAAGADCVYTAGEHVAVQGTGLPPWELGARYTNTDYTFIDDLDVMDAWRSFLLGRKKFAGQYDLARIVDTRERRQIVGDFCLSPM